MWIYGCCNIAIEFEAKKKWENWCWRILIIFRYFVVQVLRKVTQFIDVVEVVREIFRDARMLDAHILEFNLLFDCQSNNLLNNFCR